MCVPSVASVHPPGWRFPSSQAGGSGLDAGCAGLIEEIVKSEQAICHQKYHQHHQQYRRYQQKHHHHHQQQPHQHQANTLSGRDLRQGWELWNSLLAGLQMYNRDNYNDNHDDGRNNHDWNCQHWTCHLDKNCNDDCCACHTICLVTTATKQIQTLMKITLVLAARYTHPHCSSWSEPPENSYS